MAGAEGRPSELEPVVSLVDVLEEDEELENEACAVLGGSDSEKCSYSQVRARRRGPRLLGLRRNPPPRGFVLLPPAAAVCSVADGGRRSSVVDVPIPSPAAPWPSASWAPSRRPCPQGPPPPSLLLRPLGILQALALDNYSFLPPRSHPRDLLHPGLLVPTLPILRVFVRNPLGESRQS